MSYTSSVTVAMPFDATVAKTRESLVAQGFGILTEIDIRSTFAAKLGDGSARAVGDYVILGACNPKLAERALAADANVGALLPCNVVVRRAESADVTTVVAIDPQTMVQLSDAPAVAEVAQEAAALLKAALSAVATG